MKLVLAAAFVGASVLAMAAASPAQAQAAPRGSYLGSCSDVGVRGDTLVATCRRRDGRPTRTSLAGFNRCIGDIGNDDGVLRCGLPGGGQMRGQVAAEPGPPPPPPGVLGPGHPPPPGFAPPPNAPPPGDRAGCERLHREGDELRDRLARERDPGERARIDHRLHEIHEQEEHCRF